MNKHSANYSCKRLEDLFFIIKSIRLIDALTNKGIKTVSYPVFRSKNTKWLNPIKRDKPQMETSRSFQYIS